MLRSLLIAALALSASPGNPIVMRHDVDERLYLELGQRAGGSFVRLTVGCGTFIRSNWILTAGHVAASDRVGDTVEVDGVEYGIARVILHPELSMSRTGILHDIALIELTAPVPGVETAALYSGDDEVGKDIVFVGTGWAGTGDRGMADGAINRDRRLRGAQNRIDGIRGSYLQFTFEAPGDDAALPLEGISGPGDSGGPALWFDEGQVYILGVSSHQDGDDDAPEGVYGVREYYARVSEYREWILEVIGEG